FSFGKFILQLITSQPRNVSLRTEKGDEIVQSYNSSALVSTIKGLAVWIDRRVVEMKSLSLLILCVLIASCLGKAQLSGGGGGPTGGGGGGPNGGGGGGPNGGGGGGPNGGGGGGPNGGGGGGGPNGGGGGGPNGGGGGGGSNLRPGNDFKFCHINIMTITTTIDVKKKKTPQTFAQRHKLAADS
uniref:Uncharacterized protein n=1 Tax=Glossina palpalis gambiensis TaxID=67801 RepID=A0A1B0BFW9_9MUSC